MQLVAEDGDRLTFSQRRSGWAITLGCAGLALGLASLMVLQRGRDLPDWLAVPGLAVAAGVLLAAAAAWFSRRTLTASADDPARALRFEDRSMRGATQRTFGIHDVRGVALASRSSGRAHVLLLTVAGGQGGPAGERVFVLGGTERGFRDRRKAAEVGSALAAMLQCPLLERGTGVYDAGGATAHAADLVDTPPRPPAAG
jgi:hypothetical protein